MMTRGRCQFSYYCDGKSDIFPVSDNMLEINAAEWATLIAEDLVFGSRPDRTKGSTFYHASYVVPFWSASYELVATIDTHLFYVQ
jgi:spore germination cell wall hydrolase CwlJ-like protein